MEIKATTKCSIRTWGIHKVYIKKQTEGIKPCHTIIRVNCKIIRCNLQNVGDRVPTQMSK